MANFDSGVASYVVGLALVTVYFPVDRRGNAHVCCEQCEMFSRTSRRCKINGSLTEFPDRYIGSRCPLNFDLNDPAQPGENENETEKENQEC